MFQIGERYRIFLLNLGIIFASCLIYAFSYVLNLIWRIDVVYPVIISFVTSLMIGILVRDSKWALVCVCASLILGSAIATFIVVRPVMIEEPAKFDIALTVTISTIAKILLFNIIASFVGALLGTLSSRES